MKSCGNDDHHYDVEVNSDVSICFIIILSYTIIMSLHGTTNTDHLSIIRHDRTYTKLYFKIYNS